MSQQPVEIHVENYTFVEHPSGRVDILRDGKPWRPHLGDNAMLALFDEVKRLRGQPPQQG